MPIYELDGVKPECPGEGAYWVAETAVLIGRVRLLFEPLAEIFSSDITCLAIR